MNRARPIVKLPQSDDLHPINSTDILKRFGRLPVGADPKTEGLRGRTNERPREIVDASLFCYGWSCRMGRPLWVLDHVDVDYDFIALDENNGVNDFSPIQLKEVPPKSLNPQASLQSQIDKLATRYSGDDLTVAIRVNQQTMVDLDKIIIPPSLRIAALWIYGAVSPDGSRWFLYGNLLKLQPILAPFDYPT